MNVGVRAFREEYVVLEANVLVVIGILVGIFSNVGLLEAVFGHCRGPNPTR